MNGEEGKDNAMDRQFMDDLEVIAVHALFAVAPGERDLILTKGKTTTAAGRGFVSASSAWFVARVTQAITKRVSEIGQIAAVEEINAAFYEALRRAGINSQKSLPEWRPAPERQIAGKGERQ